MSSETPAFLFQPPKKKGRRPKSYYENLKLLEETDNSNNLIIYTDKIPDIVENTEPKVHKKRGRKPKGGKVVEVKNILVNNIPIPNIILHLSCKIEDIDNVNNIIKYEPTINQIDNYDFESNNKNNYLKFNYINTNYDNNNETLDKEKQSIANFNTEQLNDDNIISNSDNINYRKNISKKLKELTFKLKHNNINNKSSCFWCTCPFDNEPIYIPKYELNTTIYCYGCFCSPECACSYLMNQNIDSSSKFERYYLLNNIYGKIYNYDKNIKPAPCPHYLLNKFYGNLNIQEYRKLLENERLLLVVDKPLSQILPEIYEENEDFLISAKIVSKSSTINKNNSLKK
tara:strand:+ start:6777 stop:7805 length:1029 start_codon:yes stop_codon:yes gene_type:complete